MLSADFLLDRTMQDQDPMAIIKELRLRIDQEIESFFNECIPKNLDNIGKSVSKLITEFTLCGGKRLRPIFVIMGYRLFRNADERIFRAAISIELAQSYLLIHDDIMDQSETRRGKPSLYVRARSLVNAEPEIVNRVSQNIAIIAGDLADALAHKALLTSGLEAENLIRANLLLSDIIETTGYGQLIDIDSAYNKNFKQNDLFRMHIYKTAKYTIEGPLMLGAILSGTNENLAPLSYYGSLLGTAFQVYDDILGLFGKEDETGKSVKSDVNEGKKTLLMLKAMEKSDDKDRAFILKCLNSGNISDTDFERLKRIVVDTGSYDYSLKIVRNMSDKAIEYLSMINGDKQVKDFLKGLAYYVIDRKN